MTPEQVTRRRSWMFALIGAGIATFIVAYQYAKPWVPGTEPAPEWAPYLFAGIGIACLIAAGILAMKLKSEPTPAAVTDLRGPQGKSVIRLMTIGGIALVGLTVTNIMAPEGDVAWLAASVVLLLIMAVCFVSAGCIARKIRRTAATTGASKE